MSNTEGGGKFRHLSGFLGLSQKILLIAIPSSGIIFVLDIHIYLRQTFFKEQYLAVLLGLVLASIFLGVPAARGSSRDRLPWYDAVMALLGFAIGVFCFVVYPEYILARTMYGGTWYLVLGVVDILLVIEAARRMTGWVLVILIGVLIFYARFTYLFPVPFFGKGIPWDQLIVYLFLDSNALLGIPMWVTGAIIFGFILFGEFLFSIGGSQLLNDFAMATFGRFRGGPAKVAIVGSSLFGTISGSAVANVSATGVMTIPLMKKTGYRSVVAGAIEAAASTGGQLMPPIMGVTAFILAEFLGVPYYKVAIASLIPAILYYFALFLQVDLEAGKHGLRGLSGGFPPLAPVLKRSWVFFIPLVVLGYTLFILNFQPGKSAIAGVASLFILGFATKETRIGFRKLLNILERTGRGLLMIGAMTGIAGLIIGVIYTTGLGSILSLILLKVGGQNLFLMLLITALLCIVLGMGMPTGALYIILAVVVAPSLVEAGIVPLAAHLFIFYFGLMSMITPPICFAAYAGAAIADTNPMQTGFHAFRLGIGAYIVAFLFVYSPALLLLGEIQAILLAVAKSLAGIGFVAVACSGFLFHNLGWSKRALLFLGALAVLMPPETGFPVAAWLLNIGGIVLCLIIALWEWPKRRHRARGTSMTGASIQ